MSKGPTRGLAIKPTAHRFTRQGRSPDGGHERGREIEAGSEGDFKRFLELSPDAVVLTDREGSIVHANSAAEELFGYEQRELEGKPVEVLIPTQLLTLHVSHRSRYLEDPHRRPMGIGLELRGRRRDGAEFPADISLAPIDAPEGLLVAAAVRDITERVEADRERRYLEDEAREERETAARRVEGIGTLAGGVAHDFNNLLTVIRESARLAFDRAGEPELRELLEEIAKAVDHGVELTDQLLAFGRRAGDGEVVADLNAVTVALERLLRRTIGQRNRLDVRLEPGLAPVAAPRGQLEQVLLNLVINARDAMPDGGLITITTSTRGDHALLSVRDQGVGMAPSVAARATDPFFSTKPEGVGTGLGLATVDGIVRRLGGRVELETALGKGTTVRIHLPLAGRSGPPSE